MLATMIKMRCMLLSRTGNVVTVTNLSVCFTDEYDLLTHPFSFAYSFQFITVAIRPEYTEEIEVVINCVMQVSAVRLTYISELYGEVLRLAWNWLPWVIPPREWT